MKKILFVIPTYNERDNLEDLFPILFEQKLFHDPEYRIDFLIMDDSSPDGTFDFAVDYKKKHNQKRLHVSGGHEKAGLAAAYIRGFQWGLVQDYDAIGEMDGDLSHHPDYLMPLIKALEEYDFAIGSRYVKGGSCEGWARSRIAISRMGSFYSRCVLGLPFRDLTGGFNLWSRQVLEEMGLSTIQARGYLFQIELKYKASKLEFNGVEVPISFRDRVKGQTKMSFSILIEAFVKIWKIKFPKIFEFLCFGVVGSLGIISNLVTFILISQLLRLPYNIGLAAGFLVSATQNYMLNSLWTFEAKKFSLSGWLKYLLSVSLAFGFNLIIFNLLHYMLPSISPVIHQAIAIVLSTVLNFLLVKKLVFKVKN